APGWGRRRKRRKQRKVRILTGPGCARMITRPFCAFFASFASHLRRRARTEVAGPRDCERSEESEERVALGPARGAGAAVGAAKEAKKAQKGVIPHPTRLCQDDRPAFLRFLRFFRPSPPQKSPCGEHRPSGLRRKRRKLCSVRDR